MSEKMREEFESWWIETEFGGSREAAAHWLTRYEDAYHYKDPAQAWKAWQASRAALVVELPESFHADGDGFWMVRRSEAKQIIEAQGLKVSK